MHIEIFVVTWNEEKNLEHYLDWYNYATSVTVLDNYSTDRTCEIAERRGCKIKKWDSGGVLNTAVKNDITENCWKDSKADWVIVADVDELIYYPDLYKMLNTKKSIIRCKGYQMISEKYKPFVKVKKGVHDTLYDKCIMFRPDRIEKMNWKPGLHRCKPIGDVSYFDGPLLLHYKMNGRKELKNRYREYTERQSNNDKKNNYGWQYRLDEKTIDEDFDKMLKQATKIW